MENSLLFWRAARMILAAPLILNLEACGSAPSVSVVYPTSETQHAVEAAPKEYTPVPPPPISVPAPFEKAEFMAGKSHVVSFGAEAGFSEETKPIKTNKPEPVVQMVHPQRQPASLVEEPSQTVVPVPPTGSAAYYIPKQMVEKVASLVDLWIDRTTSIEQLKQELATQLKITDDKINVRRVQDKGDKSGTTVLAQIDGARIPIGASMVAQLRGGEDFSIEPKEPIHRSLKDADRAKWNWRVTPKHESETGILINLDIWIDPGFGKPWNDSYHEAVTVTATPEKWYEKLYRIAQGLNAWLTLLGIGGIGGLITWLMKKKNSDGKS